MANPIWKDYIVTLGSDDSIRYRIILQETGEIVYTGKAHRRPGEGMVSVRINDICADFFEATLPPITNASFYASDPTKTFAVQVFANNAWSTIDSVQFTRDWSYDNLRNPAAQVLSAPINGHIDIRQPILWTGINISQVTAVIHYTNGQTSQVVIPLASTSDFNADFNADFGSEYSEGNGGTAVFLPSAYTGVDYITIGSYTYKVVSECARYALYYVNAFGGWDGLLIEGNDLVADNLKRYTNEMAYDNRDIRNRSRRNYVNEVTRTFTLHTGWMIGDESSRMHHLINSTDVYLYDLARQEMIPVTIKDEVCEAKTFRNQGNSLVNYTIQVEEAHNRIRR